MIFPAPSLRKVPRRGRSTALRNSSSTASAESQPTAAAAADVPEPTYAELRALAFATAVPFLGFGFMDNFILIIAGDAIDTSLGVALGLSTMCAAAIGNIISDVAGIMLGAAIEDWCATHLKLPVPQLTAAQRNLRSVRFANQWGTGVGMVVGCIIGMCPLLFIDSNKIQVLKREAHLDTIFRDVMTEASSLIGAQRACLYLIVNPQEEEKSWGFFSSSKQKHPKPTPDGKFLYAKYDATSSSSPSSSLLKVSDRYIPLGRGLVSRAALTGEAWNIYSVQSEPEFVAGHDTTVIAGPSPEATSVAVDAPSSSSSSFRIENMLCVPVLDGQGRAIAVIQAVNKISKGTTYASTTDDDKTESGDGTDDKDGMQFLSLPLLSPNRGFTGHDVQVLKALATHISVSLQRMYEDLAGGGRSDDELRLRDTIAMLKDSGLEGVDIQSSSTSPSSHRTALFPED